MCEQHFFWGGKALAMSICESGTTSTAKATASEIVILLNIS